jgi:replication initiation protein RepC
MLGQEEAITVLAAICARHAAGKVRSPGGLLRRMVELHQAGGLRLDRTLFGLADKLNGNKRRGAGTDQG